MNHILIGNTFPLVLARRPLTITPLADVVAVRRDLQTAVLHSFWGHPNTAAAASAFLDVSVASQGRPVLSLTHDGYPVLDGITFRQCYVVSPDYAENFRPAIGVEVLAEQITNWQILLLEWR
jgi:hypothetical protein